MEPEYIEWGGRRWKRSPDSSRRNHRVYYVYSKWRSKEYLHRAIWAAANGAIPGGMCIHHVDGNPFNNDVGNLECVTRSEHQRAHMDDPGRKEFSRDVAIKAAQLAAPAWHRSPAGRAWHSRHSREMWRDAVAVDLRCVVCGDAFKSKKTVARTCSSACLSQQRRDSGLDDITLACPECGLVFTKNKYALKRTCGRVCGKRMADRTRGFRVQPRSGG